MQNGEWELFCYHLLVSFDQNRTISYGLKDILPCLLTDNTSPVHQFSRCEIEGFATTNDGIIREKWMLTGWDSDFAR